MRFTVKLYALLAAYVPGTRAAAPFEVELPEGSTIADLIQHLQIPPEEMKIAFVNGRMQPLEYLIQEGMKWVCFHRLVVVRKKKCIWISGCMAILPGAADGRLPWGTPTWSLPCR